MACPLYGPYTPKPWPILGGSSSPNTLMMHQDIQHVHLLFDFTPDTREMSTQGKIQASSDHVLCIHYDFCCFLRPKPNSLIQYLKKAKSNMFYARKILGNGPTSGCLCDRSEAEMQIQALPFIIIIEAFPGYLMTCDGV